MTKYVAVSSTKQWSGLFDTVGGCWQGTTIGHWTTGRHDTQHSLFLQAKQVLQEEYDEKTAAFYVLELNLLWQKYAKC